jgi:hypothetical protein
LNIKSLCFNFKGRMIDRLAQQDLNLDLLYVIYPGNKSYFLDKHIQVIGIGDLINILEQI